MPVGTVGPEGLELPQQLLPPSLPPALPPAPPPAPPTPPPPAPPDPDGDCDLNDDGASDLNDEKMLLVVWSISWWMVVHIMVDGGPYYAGWWSSILCWSNL